MRSDKHNQRVRSENKVFFLPADFAGARAVNLEPLEYPRGVFGVKNNRKVAVLESAPVSVSVPFDQLLFSAGVVPAPGGSFTSEVKVKTAAGWSPWFSFGSFGKDPVSVPGQKNRFGCMDTDVLKPAGKAVAFRFRLTLRPGKSGRGVISLAAAACTDTSAPFTPPAPQPGAEVRLRVPAFSQMTQRSPRAKDMCSPTSLAMALTFSGRKTSPLQAAAAVLDRAENIYGNWYLNAAYASSRGAQAFLARLNSLEEARALTEAGIPVVASVTYGPGELRGAPVKKTRGHLLLITGFTRRGDVLVNDPAAASAAGVRRIYRREEFARAWLDRKYGTCYIVASSLGGLAAVKTRFTELFSRPPGFGRAEREKLIESQLLTHERVQVLETCRNWARILALEQPNLAGAGKKLSPYQGWVKTADLGFRLPLQAAAVVGCKISRAGHTLSIGVKLHSGHNTGHAVNRLPHGAGEAALRRRVLATARQFLGDKYYWGGRSAWGVDCSGLVNISYRAWGVDLPRNASAQLAAARPLSPAGLKPADLIFTSKKEEPGRITHVMLYSGHGRLLEATQDSGDVREISFQKKFGLPFRSVKTGRLPSGRHIFFGTVLGGRR